MKENLLDRIATDPQICHGQPCIKGTRIMIYLILELLEAGITPAEVLRDYYPQLSELDIRACLHYSANMIREAEYVPFEMEAVANLGVVF